MALFARRSVGLVSALAFSLLWLCCGQSSRTPDRPLVAKLDGCEELFRDGVCELATQRILTLWIPDAAIANLKVTADGQSLPFSRIAVLAGQRVTLGALPVPARLSIESTAGVRTLQLRAVREFPALRQASAAAARGQQEQALSLLRALFTDKNAELAARALDQAGRLEMGRGNTKEAIELLSRSVRTAEQGGRRRLAARARLAIAFLYEYRLHDPQAALDVLAGVDQGLDVEAGWLAYHRGLIALLRGDARAALAHTREANRCAQQLGHRTILQTAGELELMQLAELGRLTEARAVGERLKGVLGSDPCDRARLLANLGWAELVSERGDAVAAERSSRAAADGYQHACPDLPRRQNALVNLALAQWKRGQIQDASQTLTDAAAMGQTAGWVKAWVLDLSARLALADGKAREALSLYEQLRERAQSSETVSAAYRAELGIGKAQVALGRLHDAALALERAELALEADAMRVPLGEGRDVFAGDRDESARLLIEVLLQLSRHEDALFVVRRARARALRSLTVRSHVSRASDAERQAFEGSLAEYRRARDQLQQQDAAAWSLPLSELSAFREKRKAEQSRAAVALDRAVQSLTSAQPWQPSPRKEGELVMAFHPLPSGWAAFAHGDAGVRAVRIGLLPASTDAKALSSVLLLPFRAEIESAESLRFITYGPLKEVDFHALPFGDGLLIDELPVAYGADLGAGSSVQPARRGGVLVVADPLGDLPAARSEGEFLQSRLQSQANLTLLSGAAADYRSVRAHLEAADVFHFAGHAEFEGGGWQSGLRLAGNAMLEPGDILTLRSVPRQVVLSGCETTRERDDVSVAAIGLAQAFLSRGAQAVVATMRPVPDTMGLTVSRGLSATGSLDLDVFRFRDILQDLRSDASVGAHWASYRMLVP